MRAFFIALALKITRVRGVRLIPYLWRVWLWERHERDYFRVMERRISER